MRIEKKNYKKIYTKKEEINKKGHLMWPRTTAAWADFAIFQCHLQNNRQGYYQQ